MTIPANTDVVVVGAGFAGLSAARDLVRLGHDVVAVVMTFWPRGYLSAPMMTRSFDIAA